MKTTTTVLLSVASALAGLILSACVAETPSEQGEAREEPLRTVEQKASPVDWSKDTSLAELIAGDVAAFLDQEKLAQEGWTSSPALTPRAGDLSTLLGEDVEFGEHELVNLDTEPLAGKRFAAHYSSLDDLMLIRNQRRPIARQLPVGAEKSPRGVLNLQAMRDLERLGIGESVELDVRGDYLMVKDEDLPGTETPLLYVVKVRRLLNGIEVQGPRATLSYFLDGELRSAKVRWPSVDPSTLGPAPAAAQVVQTALKKLGQSGIAAGKTKPTIHHKYVVTDGGLKRLLVLTGRIEGGPEMSHRFGTAEIEY